MTLSTTYSFGSLVCSAKRTLIAIRRTSLTKSHPHVWRIHKLRRGDGRDVKVVFNSCEILI